MTGAGFPVLRSSARRRGAVALTARQFRRALAPSTTSKPRLRMRATPFPPPAAWSGRQSFPVGPASPSATRHARPLLLIGGGKDRIFPASLTGASYRRYARSAAVTCDREYPGRSHYTIGEPGWEHVADYALRWAMQD